MKKTGSTITAAKKANLEFSKESKVTVKFVAEKVLTGATKNQSKFYTRGGNYVAFK